MYYPPSFTWFSGPLITYGLGGIMLGMGITLQWKDFKEVGRTPRWVLLGIALQYTVMPFLGWVLGVLFELPTFFAVGLILVSCCPGGTASNVIAYLAKANVALSVAMTAISTFTAIVFTPLLTSKLSGTYVEVASHDTGCIDKFLQQVVLPNNISTKQFETQYLHGVPRKRYQKTLINGTRLAQLQHAQKTASQGVLVRMYLPFGEGRVAGAYCRRRLKENPNMAIYGIKNLLGLDA